MSIDVMKQALEALENDQLDMVQDSEGHMVFRKDQAITALRLAIEQAEKQEPVADWEAWNKLSRLNGALQEIGDFAHDRSTGPAVPDALWEVRSMAYAAMEDTAPPQRQPHELLCVCGASWSIDGEGNEELLSTAPQCQPGCPHGVEDGACKECYRRETAPQQEKQEPVVNIELSRRMAAVKVSNFYGSIIKDAEKEIERLHRLVLQHTTPPQQEKQEPVAWRTFDGEGQYDYRTYEENEDYQFWWEARHPTHKNWVDPLYTAPPQRQPLTEEEIVEIAWDWKSGGPIDFARAIERKHGIGGEA
jgi:hypothetical protein